jgi:crotonobetaine/carnitine-CoA ligase
VPDGEPGELILRPEIRGHFFQGYHKNRQATDAAWIDGWFHTGDRLSRDAQGNYRFVDRVKDAIRRRGENVSSYEVESVLLSHPDIREAAVVAAASEHSEDEVLAAISLKEETVIDPAALIDFLRPRMAHYMIPRYIRVLDELPKTPTMKIEKHKLRAAGVTADTWDREAAGIDVKRERL